MVESRVDFERGISLDRINLGEADVVPAYRSIVALVEDIFAGAEQRTEEVGCIVGGMLIVCIAVLSILVIRQKIDRAVKLGEE